MSFAAVIKIESAREIYFNYKTLIIIVRVNVE